MATERVKVGVRQTLEDGFRSFGVDAVNDLIGQGARVVALKPVSTIIEKVGEFDGNVRLRFTGFEVTVLLDIAE